MTGFKCVACKAPFKSTARFCPYCGASVLIYNISNQGKSETVERASEIAFDQMCVTDFILIQTKNSTYRFSVVDPLARRGVLTDGRFGGSVYDAILMGVLVDGSGGVTRDDSGLKTETRALIYIEDETGVKRVTTSTITDLILIRGSGQPALY